MRHKFLALILVGCVASVANAQYSTDFESLIASADGTILSGQDGFYIPPDTVSVDYLAFTYAGNNLGIPANPTGGSQFVAGTGPAGDPELAFARAQRDVSYAGADVWTVAYDICPTFTGTLPTAQNLGSFSTQLFPAEATFILLARWTDVNTAENWNADMVWFNEIGDQLTEEIPDPNFQGLAVNQWYRQSATFDLATNQILEITLTDLTSGETFIHLPTDRYLNGGSGGGLPTPSGFRFFAGGSVAGNTLAFDNLEICSDCGCLLGDVNTDGNVDLLDVDPFVAIVTAGGFQCEADINKDGSVNLLDVNPFVDLLTGG